MLRECCFVWNHALALQRRYYKLFGKYGKPKEERRMMFVCGDDIASLIKRFENESK
jgi:hypothetical protein